MVFEQLPKGRENAITPEALAARLGLSGTRRLRAVVQGEREAGALILSSFDRPGGYYRPADGDQGRQEIQAYYKQQRALAIAVLKRLTAARRALDIPDGQLELDE